MDNDSLEEKIRSRAYELWEQAGSPEGRADEYWAQARTEIEEKEPVPAGTRNGSGKEARQPQR